MYREEQIRDAVGQYAPQLAIIVSSLISGVTMYGLFVINMVGMPDFTQLANEQPGTLAIVTFAVGGSNLVLANVLPGIIAGTFRNQLNPKGKLEANAMKMAEAYKITTIISAALCEGAGFLGVIAYQIEGSLYGLIAAVVMVIAIALMFPTPGRMTLWIDRQLQMMEDASDLHDSF